MLKAENSENIAAVAESVCEAPSTSIHRRSQQLHISEISLRWILHTKFYLFRSWSLLTIQWVFASLCGPVINLQKTLILGKKITFSDEAHFDLGGLMMLFGHIGAAIWHCWTIICGAPSEIIVTKTRQTQLTL